MDTLILKNLQEHFFCWKKNRFSDIGSMTSIIKKKLRAAKYRKKKKTIYHQLKKPCCVCGEDHPACVAFHHVNPEEKVDNISKMIYSERHEVVLFEIGKCISLCANCHAKMHYEERRLAALGIAEKMCV